MCEIFLLCATLHDVPYDYLAYLLPIGNQMHNGGMIALFILDIGLGMVILKT